MIQDARRLLRHATNGTTGTILALTAGLIGLGAAPAFSQAGPEQTQKLVKTVESTVKSIGETRQQLEKTVAGYNSIMDQSA